MSAPLPRVEQRDFINYCRPLLEQAELEAVQKVLESGWLTTGPNTEAFENEFKQAVGARHAIALNSCTAGLHVALCAMGIGPGDEVITTTYSFVATAHVITWVGARPVLVDVDPETFNISPEQLEKAITPRTKAIIPVHFAGLPCDMDRIHEIAARHDLWVIEDAAHAAGVDYKGAKIGSFGDVAVFSLYATKNITSGEGGVVTTSSDELAAAIRRLGFFGISKDIWERHGKPRAWDYDVRSQGFKYNLSDVLAALGRVQLGRLDTFNRMRRDMAHRMLEGLSGIKGLQLPREYPYAQRNWHLFPVLVTDGAERRDALITFLRERKIGTGLHYIPIHLFTFYQQQYGYKPGDFPHAEKVYATEVSLPLYPALKDEAIGWIIQSVRDFFR
ncbi:MAG: DegT/DnrJ/EryC1/StrS family aminotransferase [Myxococcaceae bacterium]|nr:DegT/DnrJ/EryC1/StrS family aminotransferase [Myxococcaceae bacterium]